MCGCGNLQTNAYFAGGAASHDSGESTGRMRPRNFRSQRISTPDSALSSIRRRIRGRRAGVLHYGTGAGCRSGQHLPMIYRWKSGAETVYDGVAALTGENP